MIFPFWSSRDLPWSMRSAVDRVIAKKLNFHKTQNTNHKPQTMNISVELTFSPLQNDFEEHIIDFIKKLRASGLTILENPLSTQVFGSYDLVMKVLNSEIKTAFELMDKGLLYMKIVKSDRSDYEPNF